MANFGLWWIRWNGSEKRRDKNWQGISSTVDGFKKLGFDYAVILDSGEGRNTPQRGYSYNEGYYDGNKFESWLNKHFEGFINYFAFIPVLNHTNISSKGIRGVSYWKGWIDEVLNSIGGNLKGFYWSLKDAWQVRDGTVYEEDIEEISTYVRNLNKKFMWIPSACTLVLERTNIFSLSRLFDYIFVQPNYYQRGAIARETNDYIPYTYEVFKEWLTKLENLKNKNDAFNIYIEMEADQSLLFYYISHTHLEENFRISLIEYCAPTSFSSRCLGQYTTEAKTVAYHYYIKVQKDILGSLYPNRAYYFSIDLNVVSEMEGFTRRLGG
ncbi:hypothetical protein PNA2_1726 [Pyrococcus sp. NA2]|uniref:DUF4855 domain-containing protein n=1 Tax=Pyrococcus sp. (strain NA2) TaxID=342949 RepID=UPI000209AB18|nr:DUF4855 domain-containing protein [Pyrococcus sp. NA2]AEC52641.1 hypothetical protein PNA2_1726 [Pyrococcus sp. NA2]